MDRYEILILTIPELTKDEESSLEDQLEKFLNDHEGSVISFDRWGKYRLAYPVRKNDYGVYFLMRFEVTNNKDFLKELRNLFYIKFNEMVMRHIVTRLKKDQSLEYKKPPSLEDIPKKHIGMFEKGEMRPRSGRFGRHSSYAPRAEGPKHAQDQGSAPASAEKQDDLSSDVSSSKPLAKEDQVAVSPEAAKAPEPVATEKVVVEEKIIETAPVEKQATAEVTQEKPISAEEKVTETVAESVETKEAE